MDEKQQAIALANRVLEKPHIDPDGDICMLARQFLRALEMRETLDLIDARLMLLAKAHPTGDVFNAAMALRHMIAKHA